MARKDCYIDHTLCSGAKYSFCDDCKKAQKQEKLQEKNNKGDNACGSEFGSYSVSVKGNLSRSQRMPFGW